MEEEKYVPSVFDAGAPSTVEAATKSHRLVNFGVDTALCLVLFPPFRFLLTGALGSFGIDLNPDDGIPLFVKMWLESVGIPMVFLAPLSDFTEHIWMLAVLLPLYYMLVEGSTGGRSLGKLVTRTIAVRTDEEPFRLKDAALRGLSRLIPLEPLSAFGKMPWHDRLSKTRVVQKPAAFLPTESPLPETSTIYDVRP
jgi:uncharacterized RDD family membrane protein YckC